ncbi:splicing factor ESS-2 homolog isoform X3 [Lontra canadensis]|uniref:splicing factor ESS-2 homolog isoform X3 n=1 Tax=Lontra canadensis TaxID=76717 RepID=UPI0013F2D658|nr:splicing factor ESS-2 homolog isoform X3 [Lontra canadensis]
METPGASTQALLLPAASGPGRKRAAGEVRAATSKQRVLDEEEYIEGLQTVIQRDFFPDVEKLQAQKEYLEAEENGDLERMRQIAIKFGSALGKMSREPPPPYVTPATFETPDVHTGTGVVGNKARGRGRGLEEGDGEAGEEEEKEPLPSLDVFLSRYTSEDNASFQEIMEVAKEKSRARHTWLYQAEEEFEKRQKDNLALPSAEHQAIESSQAGVETWKYKAKNSLMYYPEGVPDEEQLFKKPRQVVHKNTRFLRDPFSQALSRSQLQQAAALNAQHKQGKVGPDGKELIPQDSPRVGGFGFVATPSPAPDPGARPQGTAGAEDGQRGRRQEPGQEAGSLEESDGELGQLPPQHIPKRHLWAPYPAVSSCQPCGNRWIVLLGESWGPLQSHLQGQHHNLTLSLATQLCARPLGVLSS